MDIRQVVEQTARDSYGRLIAYLAVRWRDLGAAEDAIADAFLAALESWPIHGVPAKPEAWLLTAAHRRLVDGLRRARLQDKVAPTLQAMTEEAQRLANSRIDFPDERLQMLFVCAHPEIDPIVRTPLMLQAVLGIDAARIASAFVVKPSTMGQRLTRAKSKIRSEKMKLELPDANELPQRLDSVLEAIYAAYGRGWDEDVSGVDTHHKGLSEEAIYLGKLLMQFLPAEPEVQGLLALMLYCEARRDARRGKDGSYVPISEQDTSLWSKQMIMEAELCLSSASQVGRMGRFQLEAAIQSLHVQRAWTGRTEWDKIALLYEGLVRMAPTIGVLVGRAASVAEAYGADRGWALLKAIPAEEVKSYQPYWALAAHLLARLQKKEEALAAYSRAIGLSTDPSIREFLQQRANQVQRSGK